MLSDRTRGSCHVERTMRNDRKDARSLVVATEKKVLCETEFALIVARCVDNLLEWTGDNFFFVKPTPIAIS